MEGYSVKEWCHKRREVADDGADVLSVLSGSSITVFIEATQKERTSFMR